MALDYTKRISDCAFCSLKPDRIITENELCLAIRDAHPVSSLHTLIIPKRHVSDFLELYQPEINALYALLRQMRAEITELDSQITGFNIGANVGADGGQTVFHAHLHLIPRRHGDVERPRGGVRCVIPSKQDY
jgi:ATP adenylyltransferase